MEEIPAPGFKLVSGKRSPPNDGKLYYIQLRNGFADMDHKYTADQIVWIHTQAGGDVIAVREAE